MLFEPTTAHFISLLLGLAVGVVGGLLPGFGNLMSMLILFPFIVHWSPIDIFICYAVLTQISQFVGSLTSLYTGVPGEASSMPTVLESKRLTSTQLSETVAGTAVGSAIAGIVAVVVIAALTPYLTSVSWVYRTEVMMFLLMLTTFLVVTLDPQKKIIATALLLTGILLGSVGWSNTFSTGIMTFGVVELYQGIPLELAMVFLFAVPQLLQITDIKKFNHQEFKFVWPRVPILSTVWHSLLGFIGGLVPGMTTVLSSQLSYAVSSRFTNDPYKRILASETANNAGAISQLIPLLVIGLPLIASEAITLSMMETRGFLAGPGSAVAILSSTLPIFLLVSVLGLLIAWPLATKILTVLKANNKYFRQLVLILLLLFVYLQAYNDHMLGFYLVCSLALLPLTWVFRSLDTTPLIFGFFISDRIWDHGIRLLNLYF